MEQLWWKQPLRVIQTNLQIRDTEKMDTEKIASEIEAMGANVLVMNAGGIYAWYPTKIAYHTVNPNLPTDHDLLADLIASCHKRNIRLVARFDFSKCADYVYQQKPDWFSRNVDSTPQPIGELRPGNWDILYQTCINSAYRNEVAPEIIREALSAYDIDGVFLNAPHPTDCHCEHCKDKYRTLFEEELPENMKDWHPAYKSRILHDQVAKIRNAVKDIKPDAPLILYYSITADNLYERLDSCDMICCEPQDVLSLGWKEIPQSFKPALCISLGRSEESIPKPFGIIHSCPGMEWRHTGLPNAEYMYWMSQVPANGGQIWHSITGFPDTITDKSILKCVSDLNHQIIKSEKVMANAKSNAHVAMLWDLSGAAKENGFGGQLSANANGYAKSLMDAQIPFDVILPEQVRNDALTKYKVLVTPDGIRSEMLQKKVAEFIAAGGKVLNECAVRPDSAEASLLGISADTLISEYLEAAYLRKEVDEYPLIPYRGHMVYVKPLEGTLIHATLVPPFAPKAAVGAPPERASMNVSKTDIPMIVEANGITSVCFALGNLVSELKLEAHEKLLSGIVNDLLGDVKDVHMAGIRGIQLVDYVSDAGRVLHLVNGIGERPLMNNIPVALELTVDLPDEKEVTVEGLIEGVQEVIQEGKCLKIKTNPVHTWEVLVIK